MEITIDYIVEKYKHRTFYLYHILGKKWGCTLNIEKRLRRQGFTPNDCVEIKEVIGIKVADRLEKYLNEREGYSYNHTQGYIVSLLKRNKGAQVKNKKYTKTYTSRGEYKLSNRHKNNITRGLKKAYQEGRRTKPDMSYLQSEEYRKKLSKAALLQWLDPKRKEKMLKGPDNGVSVLSADDVRFIRKTYFRTINQNTPIPKGKMSTNQLMYKFKCSKGVILNVIKGKSYTSVK